jgi:hypothetical protein
MVRMQSVGYSGRVTRRQDRLMLALPELWPRNKRKQHELPASLLNWINTWNRSAGLVHRAREIETPLSRSIPRKVTGSLQP